MLLLGSIFLGFAGFVMLCFPQLIFDLTETWKHSSLTEPSRLWLLSTRIGGGIFIATAIAGILLFILQ